MKLLSCLLVGLLGFKRKVKGGEGEGKERKKSKERKIGFSGVFFSLFSFHFPKGFICVKSRNGGEKKKRKKSKKERMRKEKQ